MQKLQKARLVAAVRAGDLATVRRLAVNEGMTIAPSSYYVPYLIIE